MPQTLQCPRCKASVAVADDAGGTRVVCPHCEQPLLVPGFASGDAGDDDDWLTMEMPLAPVKPRPTVSLDDWGTKPPPPSDSKISNPSLASEKPKSAALVQPSQSGGLQSGSAAQRAVPIEYEKDFNVRCPVCQTPVGVSATQVGKQVRCRDCHTMLQVPPPPRKRQKVQIDLDTAPTMQFAESKSVRDNRPADPFARSAADLLAAAERVEADAPPPDYDVPKVGDWLMSVFGIFRQLGVVTHWLILSTLASIAAYVALSVEVQILVMALFPAGIFFAAMVLACGFTIMQSVANDEPEVTDWPLTLQPTEWLAPMMFCFAAAGLACGPGWVIGQMAFGPSLAMVFLVMASIFLIFPFVLLSMLDMQNILMPFSPEVGRSVTRCEEAWGGFYFSSLLVFAATFLWFVVAGQASDAMTAALSIPVAVATTFVYFSLLGKLAYSIGQSVNDAPRPNDIESVRQRERRASGQ